MIGARRLENLTALRGIAAVCVVLFHAVLAFAPGSPLVHATRSLPVAVSFFFVLSGFVLTWSWKDGRSLSTFAQSRAARILPVYVVSWLLAIAALSWVRWTPTQTEMLASLFLVQAWVPGDHFAMAVNVPSWSLSCEVAFYAALPFVAPRIIRASRRKAVRLGIFCAAWMIVACLCALAVPALTWWPLVRAPEFLAGVLLARAMTSNWLPGRAIWLIGGLSAAAAVLLTVVTDSLPQPVMTLVAAPGFLALISVAAARELSGCRSLLQRLPLRKLGEWSYSLYLTHWVVVVVISRFLVGATWIPLGLAASLAVAVGVHACIERPLQQRFRGSGTKVGGLVNDPAVSRAIS